MKAQISKMAWGRSKGVRVVPLAQEIYVHRPHSIYITCKVKRNKCECSVWSRILSAYQLGIRARCPVLVISHFGNAAAAACPVFRASEARSDHPHR